MRTNVADENVLLSTKGAVQIHVQIMARFNRRDVFVDYAFVCGQQIPADGTFRRIMCLSSKHAALVGANAAA